MVSKKLLKRNQGFSWVDAIIRQERKLKYMIELEKTKGKQSSANRYQAQLDRLKKNKGIKNV